MILKKEYFDKLFVGLYLFALACLYSGEDRSAFYIITIGEFVISTFSALYHWRFKRIVLNSYFCWLVFVFLLYMITPIINTRYADFSYPYFALHLMNTLTIVFMFFDMSIEKVVDVWCDGSLLGSVLTIIYIVYNEVDLILLGSVRIGESASGNVDVLGMYLGLMSIFTLYKIIVAHQNSYLIIYILQITLMFLTGSKQALIYIALSYIVFIIYTYQKNVLKYIIPFIAAVVILIAIFEVPALYELLGYRIQIMLVSFGINIGGAGLASSYSTDVRMQMIQTAFELFSQRPIFGGGWGYFTALSGFNVYSHSTYTEILVTYGLFGFLVYYSLFYRTLFKYIKIRKNDYGILFFVILLSVLVCDVARITFSQTSINYVLLFFAWKAIRRKGKDVMQKSAYSMVQR